MSDAPTFFFFTSHRFDIKSWHSIIHYWKYFYSQLRIFSWAILAGVFAVYQIGHHLGNILSIIAKKLIRTSSGNELKTKYKTPLYLGFYYFRSRLAGLTTRSFLIIGKDEVRSVLFEHRWSWGRRWSLTGPRSRGFAGSCIKSLNWVAESFCH